MWPLVLGAAATAAGYGLWKLGQVSTGRQIPVTRQNAALLILNMQSGFIARYKDGDQKLDKILRRAEQAKASGLPIIALQLVWDNPAGH